MEIFNVLTTVFIFGAVFSQLIPDGMCMYAFNCILICFICLFVINAINNFNFSLDMFNSDYSYSAVEEYTQHVQQQQRKLFDDIQQKENNQNANE
ncbi:MAG: hypothetical protein IJ365_08575 [Clostridia bacterium]|nr:hypothetical protein [Clostridia bacterium]